MSRFRNYALWFSVLMFIPLVLDSLKVYDISVILPGNYELLVKAFLGIFILAGFLNNPTTQTKGYLDDNPYNTMSHAKEQYFKNQQAQSQSPKIPRNKNDI